MQEPITEMFRKRKKAKQKSNDKKVDLNEIKANEENRLIINSLNVICSNKKSECEKDLKDTVSDIKSILKKEIPGVEFNDEHVRKSITKIDDKHTRHIYTVALFNMTEDNCKKFMKHSKSKDLQNADNSWDYVDDLFLDNEERIFKPIEKLGFKREEDSEMGDFIKRKNNKEYMSISVGDEVAFFITIAIMFIVSKDADVKENVTESSKIKSINDLFNKRKNDKERSNPLPKRIESRKYKSDEVERELKDIINFTNKLIKKDYKTFINKGISLVTFEESFYDDGIIDKKEVVEFFNSDDSFTLFKYDLWDYPSKESPRTIIDDEGTHVIYDECDKIVKELRTYINTKYPKKYDIDYYGDWDSGPYVLVLV